MSEYPAFIAALPREILPLVRGWAKKSLADDVHLFTNDHAVVACAGMGAERAVLAARAAMDAKPVTALLSVGLAGACDPAIKIADIVRAGVVIDTSTGERFGNSRFRQTLVSSKTIASAREKRRLHEAYYASAVDMEAAALARLAEAEGLYFEAIKSISDVADFELSELARFSTATGQFREAAFATYALLHPRLWANLLGLARTSKLAIEALCTTLQSELNWYHLRG